MSLTLHTGGLLGLPQSARLRFQLAAAALTAMIRSLRNRRAALRVADLPDHLLADIGLTRDDVHAALTSDWRQDPTYRLARAARDNRCKR